MIINHDVIKRNKEIGKPITTSIDIYSYTTQLYDEFIDKDYITRLNDVKQLGSITTKKSKTYTRLDYVCFQLYLFQLIKKKIPNRDLKYSLNNPVGEKEFKNLVLPFETIDDKRPSVLDIIQILIYSYNIGHFKNTFTASKATLRILQDKTIQDGFLQQFEKDIHRDIAIRIISNYDYLSFHLLNSVLLLNRCDTNLESVKLAINIITEYLTRDENTSLKFSVIFSYFSIIRNIAYATYDLTVAPIPIYIDLSNEKFLTNFLSEVIINYNDKEDVYNTLDGLNKLLKSSVYDSNENTIKQQIICNSICLKLSKNNMMQQMANNYQDFVLFDGIEDNPLNKKYYQVNDFYVDNMLKITLYNINANNMIKLCKELNKISFVRSSWYYRKARNQITLVVTLKMSCKDKAFTSYKVFKTTVNFLYNLKSMSEETDLYEKNMLLTTKFFLHYLLGQYQVKINPTIDPDICLFSQRGKKSRHEKLKKLLCKSTLTDSDIRHEIDFMLSNLRKDTKNDLAIIVCSSIELWDKSNKEAEFDGLIIYPNRNIGQILFLEAKNTNQRPSYSRTCLIKKFKKTNINYDINNFLVDNKDCSYSYTIKNK